eukprot:TRINITY_DN2624_c2_g1_i1.p1 TRINITY_DN2624_c2_g1~~TRINITY_DN2624_c2_g1_i1.p1  ORF type:complete len:640 (+),score=124.71 TRINITY_DN2624_c2_g1_i1:91-2010(+)
MDEAATEGTFLPCDLLKQCFSYLPTSVKVHVASVVDSSWREAVGESEWYIEERDMKLTESFSWNRDWAIDQLTIDTANFIEIYLTELAKSSSVKHLKLNFEIGQKLWQIVSQSGISSQLYSINCVDFMPSDDSEWPNLKSLNTFAVSKGDYWNVLPTSLESLSLSHITNSTAITHLQRLTNLTDISMASCDELTQAGFLAVAKVSGRLVSADFSNTAIDAFSLDSILQNAVSLTRLSIKDCQKLKDRDDVVGQVRSTNVQKGGNPMANIFAELKAVTKKVQTHVPAAYRDPEATEVDESEQGEAGGFLSIGVGKCLCQRKLITDLQVSGVGFLDDFGVRLILKEMRHLEVFRMTKNRDISDAGFDLDDLPLPPNLRTISIGNCIQLTDDTMKVLSRQSNLTSLNISGCTALTEKGVLAVVENCTKLKRLTAFMVSLQLATGNGLSRPSPESSQIITNKVLRALWKLPHFESFSTAWQPCITAEGFPDETYNSLKSFQADFCDFDQEAYTKIVSSFPSLSSLSITASVRPESGLCPVGDDHLRILTSKARVPSFISLQTPNPSLLTPLVADGSIRRVDLEYYGLKHAFPEKDWLDLLKVANSKLTPVFLGKYAQKLINVDAYVRFAPITAKSRLQSSVVE